MFMIFVYHNYYIKILVITARDKTFLIEVALFDQDKGETANKQ